MNVVKLFLASILLFFVIFITSINLYSQEKIITAGGKAEGHNGSINYSLGQTFYTIKKNNYGSISEGLQQPYEITVVTGVEDNNINASISVFPNPADDYLMISIENYELSKLKYEIISFNGITKYSNNAINSQTMININSFEKGIYFLKIISNDKLMKSFKIVKY